MSITKYLITLCLGAVCWLPMKASSADDVAAGLLYDKFSLTLDPGERTEILGPLFYSQQEDAKHTWSLPPFAGVNDPSIQYHEFDFAYPLLTYDRFGTEWRWQLCQLLAFAGGKTQQGVVNNHFTLFPIYFQQRSTDPSKNYTAVVPFYGHLVNRVFRDEINFVMLPLYVKTRKADVVTYNMPFPFFDVRHGDGLKGWQLWPFYGEENKVVTTRTNGFKEVETVAGHTDRFICWPFFFNNTIGIGTTNVMHNRYLIPFYTISRSKLRNSTSWLWLLGVTHTVDQARKYDEWDTPWPLIVFARGPGKHTDRVFPFFSKAYNAELESDWYGFMLYKYNAIKTPGVERSRARVLYFLYSEVKERNPETGKRYDRVDFWPFYTYHQDFNGNRHLQILAIIEPFLPTNKSIDRDYSQLYALWRNECNPRTGARQQSLLWNLYRHTVTPRTKKTSLLFGLFQYQSGLEGGHWRICYIPLGKSRAPAGEASSQP